MCLRVSPSLVAVGSTVVSVEIGEVVRLLLDEILENSHNKHLHLPAEQLPGCYQLRFEREVLLLTHTSTFRGLMF